MSSRKKLVIVGDRCVGKTEICLMLASKKPKIYVPGVVEGLFVNVKVDGTEVELEIWNTQGQEHYDRLRQLSYPDTDVILLVFSVVEPDSLSNAVEIWFPKVKKLCPKAPIVRLGCKTDLRKDAKILRKLSKIKQGPVLFEMGEHIANESNAVVYLESSKLTEDSEIEKILKEIAGALLHQEILAFHYAKPEKLRMIMVGDNRGGKKLHFAAVCSE